MLPTMHASRAVTWMVATSLLKLPLELRQFIIIETLKQGRRKKPILSKRVVDGRVRLRNRFDDNYPAETNIYIRKQKAFSESRPPS